MQAFVNCRGPASLRRMDPKPATYDEIMQAILDHVQPVKSVFTERHKFLSSRQMNNGSVNDFVSRLKSQALLCEFDSTKVDTISNQFGVGNKRYI